MKKNFLKYTKSFGSRLYLLDTSIIILNKLKIFSNVKSKLSIKKNEIIMKYLDTKYSYIINNIDNNLSAPNSSNIIWIFWYQGLDEAPFIVKKCVESVKEHCKDKKIVIIDKNNISDYYIIPNFIKSKIDTGKISLTHFSDILRMNLLKQYGGFWIDATIFLTDDPFKSGNFNEFYTIKFECNDNTSISMGKWCGFFIGGTNKEFYQSMCKLFDAYWSNEDVLIDYFLVDYFIKLCYQKNENIKFNFDSVNFNNQHIHELQKNIFNKFDNNLYQKLKQENMVHKLSYKVNFIDDSNTFYDVLFKEKSKK